MPEEKPEDTKPGQRNPTAGAPASDLSAILFGVGLLFVLVFRTFVWNKLVEESWIRWSVLGVSTAIVWLLITAFLMRRIRFFVVLRSVFVAVVITTGAMLAALLFSGVARAEVFKLFIVAYFSLLPAFLYLQFISIRGRVLWEEYIENLFRLQADKDASLPEPPKHSRYYNRWKVAKDRWEAAEDPKSTDDTGTPTLYQQKFEGVFGSVAAREETGGKFPTDKLAPIMMATILLSVGWVLVVMPAPLLDVWPRSPGGNSGPNLPLETVRFGFLGAYFYAIQLLVRRYFQNDLKASAYWNVIVRIVVVVLLTWTIDLALAKERQAYRSMFAFVVGVFPDVGWTALQALIKLPLRKLVPSLRQQFPLSNLDGLNVWYEARLLEEGVEDMQNLATCNLVDVMLNTRIPVDRLIDWIDQSLLYLHLLKEDENSGGAREKLRRYGIRTATDLQDVLTSDQADSIQHLLDTPSEPSGVLRSVNAALSCEPNLQHVRAWRRDLVNGDGIRSLNGRGTLAVAPASSSPLGKVETGLPAKDDPHLLARNGAATSVDPLVDEADRDLNAGAIVKSMTATQTNSPEMSKGPRLT